MARLKSGDLRQAHIEFPDDLRESLNRVFAEYFKVESKKTLLAIAGDLAANPKDYLEGEFSGLAAKLLDIKESESANIRSPVDFKVFGEEFIDRQALEQMRTAASLKISIGGALMPDAHLGYGLPIGGVLATRKSVIPYGVGVDIGCRVCLSVFPEDANRKTKDLDWLSKILIENTNFGTGGQYKAPFEHEVLERPEFGEIPFLSHLRSRASSQLGTSGSGNHFAEFGNLRLHLTDPRLPLKTGGYFGFLTHSGSRNLGAQIASKYTKVAAEKRTLPKHLKHLAWLDLDEEEGMEYWKSMNLAGDYASACHQVIHERIAKALGENPLCRVENHHNFAWEETLPDGTRGIVHRKGATPAGPGVLGYIPGSSVANGFLIRGRGNGDSLNSSSHGAGRLMSRSQAAKTFTLSQMRKVLEKHEVKMIGGGVDEAPMVYKNINNVMNTQADLVDVLGTFSPRVVRMA